VEEADVLVRWRHDYLVEATGAVPGEHLMAEASEQVSRALRERSLFVLTHEQSIVACTAFNARLPEVVQVGGVYTPRHLRNQGHARAAVAGSLRTARDEGSQTAVLFTPMENHPAQRAYRALGFEEVGDFGLILFAQEHPLGAST
jgi:predicted GNAT family acetyltransferase